MTTALTSMNDVQTLVRAIATRMWRRRWWGVAVAWFVCIAGWAIVMSLPNRYESTARIYVDTDSLLRPLLKGLAVQPDVGPQVEYMQRTLLSQPNLDSVIKMTDLELRATTPEIRESLMEHLAKRIEVKAEGRGRNLFTVTYDGEDPQLTQKVVQSLLTIFVESNVGASRADMEQARRFIESQLVEYERQLKVAEARLANFKIEHIGLLANPGSYSTTVDAARTRLNQLRQDFEDYKVRRASMQAQLAQVPQTIETGGQPLVVGGGGGQSSMQRRVAELEAALDNLQTRYTAQHPDVIATKRTLEQLKAQAGRERRSGNDPVIQRAPRQSMPNPVYEQLKLRLVDMEGELVSAQRRIQDQEAEVARLQQLSKTAPAVEAEYASFNRDYEVIKKNYEELVNRRESARMAQEVDAKSNKIQFRVVDPPQVPLKPSGPNRPLFMAVVLLAGLAFGVFFVFALAQLDDTFDSPSSLRDAFPVPVLGAVSKLKLPGDRRRRVLGAASFAVVCVALLVTFAALALRAKDSFIAS